MEDYRTLKYGDSTIRTINMEKEDWFVAKDISEALSISLSSDEELISLKQLFFLVEEDYSIEEKKAIHRFIKKLSLLWK